MSMGKKFLPPIVLINGTSTVGSIVSNPISTERFDRMSVEIIVTGTPTGTVTVQASNDFIPSTQYINPSVTPANWFDIPLGLVLLTGGAQRYYIDFTETGIPWMRINFASTGGAGNMTAVLTARES